MASNSTPEETSALPDDSSDTHPPPPLAGGANAGPPAHTQAQQDLDGEATEGAETSNAASSDSDDEADEDSQTGFEQADLIAAALSKQAKPSESDREASENSNHSEGGDVANDNRDIRDERAFDDHQHLNGENSADGPDFAPGDDDESSAPRVKSLAQSLGLRNLMYPITTGYGRMFSAAGPKAPVVEFTEEFVVMHPPHLPFTEEGPSEDIVIRTDKRGVLLDELGIPKPISGAKFRGNSLWFAGEQKQGTLKHYAIWFDQHGTQHKLYVNNEPLTTDIIFRLRNKTHDGELNIFPDIKTD